MTETNDKKIGTSKTPTIVEPTMQLSAALKIPPFWSNRPNLWFLQVETQFRLKGITTSQTKYDYLISSLPPESMEIVADFLLNPTEGDKYETIKKLLVSRSQDTEERRLDNLLNKIELGDLKPSELFRQMETLAGGNSLVNKPLLNKLWLNKLPPSIQPCVIAIESTHTQEQIFQIADRIFDCSDRPRVSAIHTEPQNELKNLILDLSQRISQLETRNSRDRSHDRNRDRSRGSSPNRHVVNRSRSRSRKRDEYCWYHTRFATNATKCVTGCTFPNKTDNKSSKN